MALDRTRHSIIADPRGVSLKRLAWAYGFAPKGSAEERALRDLLLERAREDSVGCVACGGGE